MIFRNYILTGLFIVVNIFYCFAQSNIESKSPKNFLVIDTVSLSIYKFGKLSDTSTKIQALAQFASNDYIIYLNHANDTAFSNPIRFFKSSIDSVLFWNNICPMVESRLYVNGLDTLSVYRYQWVVVNEAHDQAYIYCNPEFGLLALYLFHVGLLYFYEIPSIPKDINTKLLNDILRDMF